MRFPTITRNNDFRRAYARGKSFVGYSLVLYVCKNKNAGTRVGITSSKKIGNAVQRNRARRVIRAAVDAVVPKEGLGNWDLILVARTATAAQKSTQVAAVLQKLLKKSGLLKEEKAQTKAPAGAQPAAAEAPTAQGGITQAPAAQKADAPAPAAATGDSAATPTSHTSPSPEAASGNHALTPPLNTSASEPEPQAAPLQRQQGDDR